MFKRFLAGLGVFLICTASIISVNAEVPVYFRESVTLPASENEVYSAQHGSYGAKGRLYNNTYSAGNARLTLQYSTGSGWTGLETITSTPGETKWTGHWGETSDFLFRIRVFSSVWYNEGNPGRIETGSIYTE